MGGVGTGVGCIDFCLQFLEGLSTDEQGRQQISSRQLLSSQEEPISPQDTSQFWPLQWGHSTPWA